MVINNCYKSKVLIFSIWVFSIFSINLVLAANNSLEPSREDPVQFLHSKIDRVLTELKVTNNKKSDLNDVIRIVDNLIMPNVDFNGMGEKIATRSIWNKSSDTDREAFIKELKNLLIKTYAITLKNYTEEKIEFQNYTGKLDATRIQIKSTVIRPNKENLSVDYRLVAVGNSWKVYDLIIEGVSILNGFVVQFGDDIRMNGLKFVTKKIKDHNQNNVTK